MPRVLTILFYLFIARYATLDCTTHAQCEAVQQFAFCSSGKCSIQPCGGTGFCVSSLPLVLPPCCFHPSGEPIREPTCFQPDEGIYRSCKPNRATCFFPDCHSDLCVRKTQCDERVQCTEDSASCRCLLGRCLPQFKCTQNQDCASAVMIDGLCVNGFCKPIECPHLYPTECHIEPGKVHGCVSEVCNSRGNCQAIACPGSLSVAAAVAVNGDNGTAIEEDPDDGIDSNSIDGVGLEIQIEAEESPSSPLVFFGIGLFIIFITFLIIVICVFVLVKKRK